MQQEPLLEKLDCILTYPSTIAYPLVKPTLDHVPCVISISSKILKAKIFRFENVWLQHNDYKNIVQNAWNIPIGFTYSAKRINAKVKNVRRALKIWSKNLPCLNNGI
jgi:hypothetical protein